MRQYRSAGALRTCLIYGQDGLDLDVAYNLKSFYEKRGFMVAMSMRLFPVDLLVVTRLRDSGYDIAPPDCSLIHMFDYTGCDLSGFARSADGSKTYIFTTTAERKKELVDGSGISADHVFVAFPPVDFSLWKTAPKKEKYRIVHIGTYKNLPDPDVYQARFKEIAGHYHADIWGRGWQAGKWQHHGKAGLFSVSGIYSRSRFAMGLMYPYQREITFSDRFWHAPLNGCYLLSEPGYFTGIIPGIIQTDYSIDDVEAVLSRIPDRNALRKESLEFWEANNQKLNDLTSKTYSLVHGDKKYPAGMKFFLARLYNLLFLLYQKSGLSVLKKW